MNTQNYAQPYYWYYATREEALKWPIAPGNMLTFKDPDGKHYYEKSLGWSPYEGVKFVEFELKVTEEKPKESVAIYQETIPVANKTEVEDLKNDIYDLKNQIAELIKMQAKPYYNKKEGGKQ